MNIILWMIACYAAGNDTNRLALEARRPDGYAAHGGRILDANVTYDHDLVVRLYDTREDAEEAARAYKTANPHLRLFAEPLSDRAALASSRD